MAPLQFSPTEAYQELMRAIVRHAAEEAREGSPKGAEWLLSEELVIYSNALNWDEGRVERIHKFVLSTRGYQHLLEDQAKHRGMMKKHNNEVPYWKQKRKERK